jgi:prefoldin subunit 5
MTELPKKFPEYSIMYKTLNKKIQELKNKKEQTQEKPTLDEIQSKIEQYQKEMNKIKSIFPENFFE